VRVAEVGRQDWQTSLRVLAVAVPAQQRLDRKSVAKIVQARSAAVVLTTQPNLPGQSVKRPVYLTFSKRLPFRVASTNALLSTPISQKSINDSAVQSPNRNLLVLQPAAEIGDGDGLPSDRVVRIAPFGDSGRVGVEVFAQRTLAKPFNRAWEREEFVYHPFRVPSDVGNYAATPLLKCRRLAVGTSTCGIVRDAA